MQGAIGIPLAGSPGTADLRMDRDMTYLIVESDRGKSLTRKSRGAAAEGKNAQMGHNISHTINCIHSEYSTRTDASLHS